MSKNYGLAGQAARETDGYGIDLKLHGLKSNWRAFGGLSGIRRQRRERAAHAMNASAYGGAIDDKIDADLACGCDDCTTPVAPTPVSVTFDADGAHVDNCDLPRCPECAEILGCKPWWEEEKS